MEEKELLIKNKKNLIAWRENHDEDALMELMNANRGFIAFFANKYSRCRLSYEELFSIGHEAFFKAINRFDYKNNSIFTFSTYVGNAIKRAIVRELQKEYLHKNDISIYAPIGRGKNEEVITLEDTLGTDDDELVDSIIVKLKKENIQKFFGVLTPIEKRIIVLRFAFEKEEMMTIPEISKELKISKAIVKRHENRAILKLRKIDALKDLMG